MSTKDIWLDMDGNFVALYEVPNWLDDLIHHRARPYKIAKPLVDLKIFSRLLNNLQEYGYTINIVSWLAKDSNKDYDTAVTQAKLFWLKKHLPEVNFNKIEILPYGTPKSSVGIGYLFDDEKPNRDEWKGIAYSNTELITKLQELATQPALFWTILF